MEFQIEVKELLIVKNRMTLTVMGTVTDPTINSHFLSNPKLVLHFNNGKEDRRIPFVLSNVTHIDGKCFFSGRYNYRLDLLFWKTRKDFYEEKIPVDLTPAVCETDDKYYRFSVHGNKFEFEPDKKKIKHNPVARFFVKLFNGIVKTLLFIITIGLLPFFVVEALLRMTGIMNLPKRFNDPNPLKRFIAYIFWRFSRVSTTDLSIWKVKRYIFRRCFGFYKTFCKVRENKITFISLRRDDLSGNFAFVYDKIKDDKNLDINFILNDHTIAYMSFKEIRAFWHACGAFKTFGFTRLSKPKGSPQPTRNHRSYDFVTVSSTYCKKCHSEGFGIPTDNVVATGIPRTDVFFDENYKANARKKFYREHPTFKGKKIILFAPTFRGMVKETAFYPTEMFDISEVCAKIPEDYAIIIKHHPFVNDVQPIPDKYADRVIDLSADNELNDLLFVTDVIITDYSSLVFEASLIDIPMIFYVFDLEKYINERDFYFDFKLYAPGKIVYSTEQLITAIKNQDYCTERIKPFADMFFDYRDGKSTERVVNLIYDNLKNNA